MEEDFDFEKKALPEEPFHIEVDIYETGDYSRLLVVPCDLKYVIVSNDEHLCTLVKSCDNAECWEQEDGSLDDELVEKLGAAIESFTV